MMSRIVLYYPSFATTKMLSAESAKKNFWGEQKLFLFVLLSALTF